MTTPPSSCSPSPPPPPIPSWRPLASPTANPSSLPKRRCSKPQRTNSHHLSFLYPPSCLELSHTAFTRAKSSLAPTSAVAAAAPLARQQSIAETDDHDAEFTFLRHHYEPPRFLIDHPPSNHLIQQDATSHLEAETLADPTEPDASTSIASVRNNVASSAAALSSLRRKSSALRRSLHQGQITDPNTIIKQSRRLVLQASRIPTRLHARTARAIASEIVSDCALHLVLAGEPIAAADIIRHLLVKLGWSPHSASHLEMTAQPRSNTALNRDPATLASTASGALTAAARLLLITQHVISQLSLAPSPYNPRPTRRFSSQKHLDAATSLVSAMYMGHMARSTTSQTALIRAMIASGQPRLAVQTFCAEVRAWWNAHRQVRRPHLVLRRQAALVAEIGKPSSQALREITRSLQQLEELLNRVRPDLLPELSENEQQALQAKRSEYAESLVELLRLVRGGRLPLPPLASGPELAWILSACCRFDKTTLLDSSTPFIDAAEKHKLRGLAHLVRYFLCEYMRSLPDGQTRSVGNPLLAGNSVVRPPLSVAVYNQLIHYALSVLRSPSICKAVFQHMTQHRQPPLEPDAVTFNTILRQATTQRYEALARAVVITTRPEQAQLSASHNRDESALSTAVPASERRVNEVEPQIIRPMLQQIDAAVAQADSYRLVSLLQYVTAASLFLRRYRHEPGYVGVKELVMRIYPALNKKRHVRPRAADRRELPQSLAQTKADGSLRPKANQASRHAIHNPHVLTATLNLAAKAGKTGLALRIWRLIKRTSLQSELQSPTNDVAAMPWKIPVETATILMSVLANESAKMPKMTRVSRSQRVAPGRSRTVPQGRSRLAPHRQFARGWNIFASLRTRSYAGRMRANGSMYNSAAELGEGLRWRAAQLLAKREYAFLVHHWQLSQKLSSWRRKRVESWTRQGQYAVKVGVTAEEAEENPTKQPDSRFYDALLNVFGRRVGMIQRSRQYRSRSEYLSRLRRGCVRAAVASESSRSSETRQASGNPRSEEVDSGTLPDKREVEYPDRVTSTDNLQLISTRQLLEAVVARISWNSQGRRTSLPPDAFLVRILLDMEAMRLEIPVAYRWILSHCSIAMAERGSSIGGLDLLQNDSAGVKSKEWTGAFSPFRGPRIKTVGLIARRRNSALVERTAKKAKRA